ncbi:ABC transporter permease [Candidatus Entotheonella palauensis]|uniref:ABC transporter permease n=1 Tax=Candidatus Entotheonella palauensis TaxID=93172 RepID=UPI0015C446F5|nr:ABC transporter permease [Candidatus Entotheonella palauensis]
MQTTRMTSAFSAGQAAPESSPSRLWAAAVFFKQRPLGALAAGIILVFVLMGALGPFVAPYDPEEIGVAKKYAMPSIQGALLGADQFGRDVLSRMLYGIRISMLVGVVASFVGTVAGAILGLVSGYWSGKVDAIVQRIVDILMSFPLIILALTLLTALAPSLPTVIIAIGVPFIPYGARVVRASTMIIKELQYVEAARAIGCSDLRIIFRHIAPGCVALYIVLTTGLIGVAIITESALGFLGLSIPPPTPTLGAMLSEALTLLMFAPHVAVAPGVAITLVVFAFNILGDSLRDVLDPRLRGSG